MRSIAAPDRGATLPGGAGGALAFGTAVHAGLFAGVFAAAAVLGHRWGTGGADE